MQNGPITEVNKIPGTKPAQPFLLTHGVDNHENSRPASTGASLTNNFIHGPGSIGADINGNQTRPSYNFNRTSATPPQPVNFLRPTSLPSSLNTSPSRKPELIGSAHSTSNLAGPQMPQTFRPPVNGFPRMPPPNFSPPVFNNTQVRTPPPLFTHGGAATNRPPSVSQTLPFQPPPFQPPPSRSPFRPPPQPPTPQPPTSQPSTSQPHLNQPPTSQPHLYQPPTSETAPSPVFQPPTSQPPTSQPHLYQPPTSQPHLYQPPTSETAPSPVFQPPPSQPLPPPPSGATSNVSRLGPGGLKAKRPVPSYNVNHQPASIPTKEIPTASTRFPEQYPTQDPVQPLSQLPSQPTENHGAIPSTTGLVPPSPMEDPATQRMRHMSLSDMSFINLMEHRSVFPKEEKMNCLPPLPPDFVTKNKYPEHFCSSLNTIPSSSSLLSKLKVPFGLIIQPFKNLEDEVPVITPPIPRCKVCRTYVNPYVQLNDGARRWKCNICARLNDMPADYFYGEDGKRVPFNVDSRPELNSALVEYIAPTEYTTRPPQAAVYLYLLDVSVGAVQSGMVKMACKILEEELDSIPGDSRKSIGILCFSSKLHYFNIHKNSGQPQMLVVADLDEPFIPTIDELIVNIEEHKQKIKDLLAMIPSIFADTSDPDCAVGPALKAAKELIFPFGGRLTLLVSRSPSVGIGTIKQRSDTSKIEGLSLAPLDDFYKTLALECTQRQVTVDLFLFPNNNIDVPTISAVTEFSAGTVFYYPQYHFEKNLIMAEKFVLEFRHYVLRPVAFEAVLRIRSTSGISIHSFFGNCFVRAHDLIALANVSPDVSFGVQINIDDTLHESKLAIFQSALLYTSAKGDRRIRVHTLALPVSSDPQTIYNNLNIDASISLLAKLAVTKCNSASLGDAREALQYSVIDPLIRYKSDFCPASKGSSSGQLYVPTSQRLLPLYISSLLRSKAFRLQNVSVDERFFAMLQYKTLPIEDTMLMIYPRLFSLHNLGETWTNKSSIPPRLSLTAEKLTRQGAFLLQTHEQFIIWIGRNVSEIFVNAVYNIQSYNDLPEIKVGLDHHDNAISDLIHDLLSLLSKIRNTPFTLVTVREDSRSGHMFLQYLIEDRSDGQISYYEFLQKVQQQVG